MAVCNLINKHDKNAKKLALKLEAIHEAVTFGIRQALSEKSFKSLLVVANNMRIPDAFRYSREELIDVITAAKIQPEPIDPSFASSYFNPLHQDFTNELIDNAENFYNSMSERYPLIYSENGENQKYARPRTPSEVHKAYRLNTCAEAQKQLHYHNALPVMVRIGNVCTTTNYFQFAALRTFFNLPTRYYIKATILRKSVAKITAHFRLRDDWTGSVLFNIGRATSKLTLGSFLVFPLSNKPIFTEVAFRFSEKRNMGKLDPGGLLVKVSGTRWWVLPEIDEHPFMLEWLFRFAAVAANDADYRWEGATIPGTLDLNRNRMERRDIREGGIYQKSGSKGRGPRGEETDTFD